MFRFLRRLVSCVRQGKIYMSSISGDSPPSKTSKHDTKMLKRDYSSFKTDEGQSKDFPYTQKFRKKYGPSVKSFQTFLSYWRAFEDT